MIKNMIRYLQRKIKKLYELYIEKLQNTIYSKRVNSPVQILMDGQEQFGKLNIKEQCVVLMNIQTVFGRMTSGCDLSLSGGSPNSVQQLNSVQQYQIGEKIIQMSESLISHHPEYGKSIQKIYWSYYEL